MSSRVQGTKVAVGVGRQADIATATSSGGLVSFSKLNSSLGQSALGIETDEAEYGKIDEFATQQFATAWDTNLTLEKYGTSQFAAWAWAFALGKVTATGGGYTITPINPEDDGIELPYFTYCQQTPGTDLDETAVGCCIEEIKHTLNSGPGRQNNRIQITAVGSGKLIRPSGVTIPPPITENLLPVGGAQITINGTDYVTKKSFVSLELGWKNNLLLKEGFFPGSGTQDPADPNSGQIRGRIEIGTRKPSLSIVVRARSDSDEAAKAESLTTGTAVISLPISSTHSLTFTFAKIGFDTPRRTDTSGIATITLPCNMLKDTTNNTLLTITANTNLTGIAQ